MKPPPRARSTPNPDSQRQPVVVIKLELMRDRPPRFAHLWETADVGSVFRFSGALDGFFMPCPVLFIIVAIAGLAFGEDAARGAIAVQLRDLMGNASADLVQNIIQSASGTSSGILASLVGVIALIITASGVFGEMQSALNVIWKAFGELLQDRIDADLQAVRPRTRQIILQSTICSLHC
jgi:Virulence factor BrkB